MVILRRILKLVILIGNVTSGGFSLHLALSETWKVIRRTVITNTHTSTKGTAVLLFPGTRFQIEIFEQDSHTVLTEHSSIEWN